MPLGTPTLQLSSRVPRPMRMPPSRRIIGQPVKDTLCGTKVLFRRDYLRIVANRHQFGDFDPFGDFDLLFGARKLNLKIVDIPIRYREPPMVRRISTAGPTAGYCCGW
jgi:hypothetical protein